MVLLTGLQFPWNFDICSYLRDTSDHEMLGIVSKYYSALKFTHKNDSQNLIFSHSRYEINAPDAFIKQLW